MRKHHVKKQLKRLGLSATALVFLFFMNSNVIGQGGGAGSLQFGGKLGITSSTLSNDHQNMLYSENKVGFAMGGFVSYQILDFLGAEVDLLYAQEGAAQIDPRFIYYPESLYSVGSAKLNSNITMHNIEIPLLLNFYVPGYTGDAEPRFYVGGSWDIITKTITKDKVGVDATDGNVILTDREKEDVSSSIERNNFGFIVGAGLNFNGGDLGMTLDVRYKIGLSNISNLATLNYSEYTSYYTPDAFSTNCIMVLVGVALP